MIQRLAGIVVFHFRKLSLSILITEFNFGYGEDRILLSDASYQGLSPSQRQNCRFLGQVQVKGKIKPIGIYEALEGDDEQSRLQKLDTLSQFLKGVEAYQKKDIDTALPAFNPYYHSIQLTVLRRDSCRGLWKEYRWESAFLNHAANSTHQTHF